MNKNTIRANTPAERIGFWLKSEVVKYAKENDVSLSTAYYDFAERLYVDQRTVQRYCSSGISNVNTVAEIASALGLNLADVLSEGEVYDSSCRRHLAGQQVI